MYKISHRFYQSLTDQEIAFIRVYDYPDFMIVSKIAMDDIMAQRNLYFHQLKKLVDFLEYNIDNDHCPRCNSKKIAYPIDPLIKYRPMGGYPTEGKVEYKPIHLKDDGTYAITIKKVCMICRFEYDYDQAPGTWYYRLYRYFYRKWKKKWVRPFSLLRQKEIAYQEP